MHPDVRHFLQPLSAILLLLLLSGPVVDAQEVVLENQFSAVHVATDQKSGRFWFSSGKNTGYNRYTYKGSGDSKNITTNVVFRVQRGTDELYYTNVPTPNGNGGVRPSSGSGEAIFAPYDSLYMSPGKDTLEIIWKEINVYSVKMRFVAEKPRHEYDDGADILLEFEWKLAQAAPSGTNFGVFLMLDLDNGSISGSDQASIMTDRGYYPSDGFGAIFTKQFTGIPDFYIFGKLPLGTPNADLFPIHRLVDTSLGGAPLTTPDELDLGRWHDFRQLTWLVNGDVTSKPINDAATITRWGDLGSGGKLRTAFGTKSTEGNNVYHCRDSNLFLMMRATRLIKQKNINGQYLPDKVNVEVWVTNLHPVSDRNPVLRLQTPITSFPTNDHRVTLDPSTPSDVELTILPQKTKKIVWTLNVDQNSKDSLVELKFLIRDTATKKTKPFRPLAQGCTPHITFRSAFTPPPPDDRPPIIEAIGNGRDVTAWWTFRTYDRHAGFRYDEGLDRIEITRNDGNNFRLITTPQPFTRCDTNVTVNLRAEVIDTSRAGLIEFTVYDCKGNSTKSSAAYTARPDLFKPELVRIDSVGRYDRENYPCAVPQFDVYLQDRSHQSSAAGDIGFGSISVISSTNFRPIEINFDRGMVAIRDFDPTASVRLTVDDTLSDADITIRFADIAGNADTLSLHYCTLPDVESPRFTSTPGPVPDRNWTVEGSDTMAWDRGLGEIILLSQNNMTLSPWPLAITPGDRVLVPFTVSVTDDAWPASVSLELRDRYYDADYPDDHVDRISFSFPGTPDTMKPNVSITRDFTVPSSDVVFNVAVSDSHSVSGNFYRYDRGLKNVSWTLTSNMQVITPITFTDNRRGASFRVQVIDPFALIEGDTLCVNVVDSADLSNGACAYWPSKPDDKSPLFVGRIDQGRTFLTGTATDSRQSDRGLGSIELINGVNIASFSMPNLAGAYSAPISIQITDPTSPVSGELVVTDLVGISPEGTNLSLHQVSIPFELPVIGLDIALTPLVEGGESIGAAILATNEYRGDLITSVDFDVSHSTNGTYNGAMLRTLGSIQAAGSNRVHIHLDFDPTRTYAPGDTLGILQFTAASPNEWDKFSFGVLTNSLIVNNGAERSISVTTPGDDQASVLTLPAPFFRVTSDTLSVINGYCNRTLASEQGALKSNRPQIVQISPQPVAGSGDRTITLFVRNLPERGGTLELINLNGRPATEWNLEQGAEGLSTFGLQIPEGIANGTYLVRLMSETGQDLEMILIR